MENTKGAVISIATGESIGVYSRHPHIPFPNSPVSRGNGMGRPESTQGENTSLVYRAVILGDFTFLKVPDVSRAIIEDAIVSTPPLCLYRHALWGAQQNFPRNLPHGGAEQEDRLPSGPMVRRTNHCRYGWVSRTKSPHRWNFTEPPKAHLGRREVEFHVERGGAVQKKTLPVGLESMCFLCERSGPFGLVGKKSPQLGWRPD